jgi:ATP-dependent helicase/nuclease subunit A
MTAVIAGSKPYVASPTGICQKVARVTEPLALEQNLALMAGAGAGKTHSLMTLCLHLFSGARRECEPLRPSQLCLLTFTDKAAAEMRTRLRARVDVLASGASLRDHEPELWASFQRLSLSEPSVDLWRQVRDNLGATVIGTFHALCVQLLRRAPAGFGVDPSFELLDETDANALIGNIAERLVLSALERDQTSVIELCRELGFRGHGHATGLVDLLCTTYSRIREEGLAPGEIAVTDEVQARKEFEERLSSLKSLLTQALAADGMGDRRFSGTLSQCARAASALTFENFLEAGHYEALVEVLESEPNLTRQRKEPLAGWLKEICALAKPKKESLTLREYHAAARIAPHERAFVALLAELRQHHSEALTRQAKLDFTELLIRTRDLLQMHLPVREEVQRRIGALMVDEFQDTNRLQLELVLLLAEKREGGPRPTTPELPVTSLPLEPAFLCIVGDRKQSIYEFRGADVSVFGALADKIEREGGGRAFLKKNWRSTPQLLEFFNGVFAQLLRAPEEARPYEVVYEPLGDDLQPARSAAVETTCVDRLLVAPGEDAAQCRAKEAEAVAGRIRQLLADDAPPVVQGHDGAWRRARGGDIAILFRRFVYLETYRQALVRHRIPHRIVRGRGFYGAQEVLDLASFLSLIADPNDNVSLAAVLRSPLVGVSNALLFKLSDGGGQRLSLRSIEYVRSQHVLSAEEDACVAQFLNLYRSLHSERDRLGVRELLKVALAQTGYRLRMAGTPFGEQALANLDKLLELAGRAELQGRGDCVSFAANLLELASTEPTEAQADVLDAGDVRAVQLLTIHAAKGLEFPIVFVPDLAAAPQPVVLRVPFERSMGLCIKPWVPDRLEVLRSPRSMEIGGELQRRERAEYLRLLYVALTRARDRLVLSGVSSRKLTTWRSLLDGAIEGSAVLRQRVADVTEDDLRKLPDNGPQLPKPSEKDAERLEQALRRTSSTPVLRPRAAVYPVTHLQDFSLCPRRYWYARHVGLAEFPMALELDAEREDVGGSAATDTRMRGTLTHRLLEQVDFRLALEGDSGVQARLTALLWSAGVAPDDPGAQDILRWVHQFLRTPFAQRLAKREPRHLRRELPFLLRLDVSKGHGQKELPLFAEWVAEARDTELHLKGQIDLLVEEDDGSFEVVDYKTAHRHSMGLEPYAFQLDCYALAVRQLLAKKVALRTGVSFLQELSPEPEFRPVTTEKALAQLTQQLRTIQLQLLENVQRTDWPGREPGACAKFHCGYQYRCHPATPEL